MARHARDLGCADARAYLALCQRHGFSKGLRKSSDERAREREAVERLRAARDAQLRETKRLRADPRRFLEAVCADSPAASASPREEWRRVAASIERAGLSRAERRQLAPFLLHVDKVSKLVFASFRADRWEAPAIDGLLHMHRKRGRWLRDPLAWRPDRRNPRRQFASLLRHLFTEFPAPAFLETAWLRNDSAAAAYREWWIHLGAGRSMRAAATPYPLTRKTAHLFVTAPEDLSVEAALIFADVVALGGDRRLVEALAATRLGGPPERDPERRAFWLSAYRFFIENPMLDRRHVGPIVDFLAHQKFEPERVMLGGRMELRPPPQPNLSMARRRPEALLRQVDDWHRSLAVAREAARQEWRPCGRPDFAVVSGPADRPGERTRWSIGEILTAKALAEEGRRMRHCVSSYAESCARGRVAIWSLRRQGAFDTAPTRVLTISTAGDRVIEARGLANRLPTAQEWGLVKLWMGEAALVPGPYLAGWRG